MRFNKKNNHLHVESHIFKRVRECPLNIVCTIKILHTQFKYNIATYKFNVYKTSAKQPQLIYSLELSIANLENMSSNITFLQKT